MIVTKPRTKQEKKLQTVAEADLRAGLAIFNGLSKVIRTWNPMIAAMEAGSGSQSSIGAKALARSQQAAGDAVYRYLGALPICFTVQAVKKASTGKLAADKQEIEAAVRSFWAGTDLDELLKTPPPYLEQGQKVPPRGKWADAFDALSVAHAARDHASVAAARRMAA